MNHDSEDIFGRDGRRLVMYFARCRSSKGFLELIAPYAITIV